MDYLDEGAPDSRSTSPQLNAPFGSDTPDTESAHRLQDALGVGDLYARAGDHAEALHTWLELWNSGECPRTLGLARRIAHSEARLGQHLDAIRLLAPLLASLPDPVELSAEDRLELGRCRVQLGKSYLEAGQLSDAQAEGLRAVSLFQDVNTPDSGVAHNLLGTVCFRRGDIDEAKVHFRAALAHFRQSGDIVNLALGYLNLGHVHKHGCEWERALEHYQAAYYLRATEGEFQDQGAIIQSLALVLMKMGRYEEARGRLEMSLRHATELNSPARALRSHLALARLARESWEFEAAREHLAACAGSLDPLPEREACLLMLEEAHLARSEGRGVEAAALVARLRDRVEHSGRPRRSHARDPAGRSEP